MQTATSLVDSDGNKRAVAGSDAWSPPIDRSPTGAGLRGTLLGMPAEAGGVGLGLIFGWLAAATLPVRRPAQAGAVLAALGGVVVEVAAFGDAVGAGWCVAAMAAGGAARLGVAAAVSREVTP